MSYTPHRDLYTATHNDQLRCLVRVIGGLTEDQGAELLRLAFFGGALKAATAVARSIGTEPDAGARAIEQCAADAVSSLFEVIVSAAGKNEVIDWVAGVSP